MRWTPRLALLSGTGALAMLLVAGCSVLKLVSGTSDRSSYYPLAVGDVWEYRLATTFERGTRLDTTTVASYRHRITGSVRLSGGQPALMHVWDSDVTLRDTALPESSFSQAETTYFRRTKTAVYRYATPADKADSILLLPIEMDQRWVSDSVRYWVSAKEDVTINGRVYPDCWRIQSLAANDPSPLIVWFARGVGLVRMVNERVLGGHKMRTDYYLLRSEIRD